MSETFQTFTSFSGADVLAFVNDIQTPEINEVQFKKLLHPTDPDDFYYPVKGTVTAVVFDDETHVYKALRKRNGSYDTFILQAVNEYGQALSIEFIDCEFIDHSMKITPDDVVMCEVYTFRARDVRFHKKRFYRLVDLSNPDELKKASGVYVKVDEENEEENTVWRPGNDQPGTGLNVDVVKGEDQQ